MYVCVCVRVCLPVRACVCVCMWIFLIRSIFILFLVLITVLLYYNDRMVTWIRAQVGHVTHSPPLAFLALKSSFVLIVNYSALKMVS